MTALKTHTKDDELFVKVRESIVGAKLIAWDGCHKIYLAMDDIEADWFRENYGVIDGSGSIVVEADADTMLDTLMEWWNASCGLRFISAVHHNAEDANKGFVSLISQFEDYEEEGDEE